MQTTHNGWTDSTKLVKYCRLFTVDQTLLHASDTNSSFIQNRHTIYAYYTVVL